MKVSLSVLASVGVAALIAGSAVTASAADAKLEAAVRKEVGHDAQPWLTEHSVVKAVEAQNKEHKSFDQAKIDELDNKWKTAAKTKDNPMFDKVTSNAVSKHLKSVVAKSHGKVVEILLMDDRGLNVAQTEPTSDYWQGDEPKWQKVFKDGSDVYMTDPEKDDKSGAMLTEVSVPVVDPASKHKIGVAMIVLDTNKLSH